MRVSKAHFLDNVSLRYPASLEDYSWFVRSLIWGISRQAIHYGIDIFQQPYHLVISVLLQLV